MVLQKQNLLNKSLVGTATIPFWIVQYKVLMDFLQEVFTSPELDSVFPGKFFRRFCEVASCTNYPYALLLSSHEYAKQLPDSFYPNRRLGFVAFALNQMRNSIPVCFYVPTIIWRTFADFHVFSSFLLQPVCNVPFKITPMKVWEVFDFPPLLHLPNFIKLLAHKCKDSKRRNEEKVPDGHANKNRSGLWRQCKEVVMLVNLFVAYYSTNDCTGNPCSYYTSVLFR